MLKERIENQKIPKKLKFFLEIREEVNFITSFFTEAEVARELVSAYNLKTLEFDRLWQIFLDRLKCKYIAEFKLNKDFASLPKIIKLKLRTIINFIHLFIAMKEGAYLISGDNDLIKIVRENKIYSNILSYLELRRLFSYFSNNF